MNKERRNAISNLRAKLDMAGVSEIKDELETHRDNEQEYYDNMPESFQDGDKGQAAQAAIDALESAIEALDAALESVEDAMREMETACE
jgi:uncharacterized coiled-coil DUF342 family protein